MNPDKKRVAICLRGAISKLTKRFELPNSLYDNGTYINYNAVYNSIIYHIVNANPTYEFDFYIHCWNKDLKDELLLLYNPKNYLFEDNNIYRNEIINNLKNTNKSLDNFFINSQFLSISKSIKLLLNYIDKEKYLYNNIITYDYVILYRPDIILLKDIKIDLYNNNEIYVNGHKNSNGDFHFIMNLENSYKFINLYETTKTNNIVTDHELHGKVKMFVQHYLNKSLIMDNIIPGLDQEVVRKLKICSIDWNNVPIENFIKYGFTIEQLLSYNIL